jgi:hypothetical protein
MDPIPIPIIPIPLLALFTPMPLRAPLPLPKELGDPALDAPALPGFGVPGSIMDPNCGCCCDEYVCDEISGRVALLTPGGGGLVLDVGSAEPKRLARSSTPVNPPFEGALSSRSMSDKSFFADDPPSSAGMGLDENE